MSKARLVSLLLVASLFAFIFALSWGHAGMSDGGGFHFF
jgi:hypothetical protein